MPIVVQVTLIIHAQPGQALRARLAAFSLKRHPVLSALALLTTQPRP